MPVTEKELFAYLDSLDIAHETITHKPLFTVEDGRDIRHTIPGLDCKNLFLKDKKSQFWLIVMPGDKRARITALEKTIGSARLSFASPELLLEILGITPGSVTPFALMNDIKRQVRVVLDQDMMAEELVNFHPLRNDASTALKAKDLLKFIKSLSYDPPIVNCGEWAEMQEAG